MKSLKHRLRPRENLQSLRSVFSVKPVRLVHHVKGKLRPVIAGKLSFDADKLLANVNAVVEAVQAAKPAAVKGVFIKTITLSSTMGIGVPCTIAAAE